MPKARANGIDIAYETFGSAGMRPLILIMGIGSQMVSWPTEFCEKLAATGHFVVRFDNRDVGLTTKLEHAGIPNIWEVLAAIQAGSQVDVPYRLSDMAADTVGLMDSLHLAKAHICGLSMGGMIAQTIAIEHQHRVLSLISMESTTGEPGLPSAKPEVGGVLLKPPPEEREAYIQFMLEVFRLFAGDSDKYDEATQREISALSYDRSFYPAGFARQFAAIVASGSRRKALASVRVPTLVIHGANDTLFPREHGKDTADAIAGAQFLLIKGLGHGTAYPGLWDEIVAAIAAHTKATGA
ncbi:MAG: alpha/beta fold hydrolase [Desulfobacterales bacterium]|nr:alpha/beta fold hydrolase [Desulfobacterales bacterium]